MPRKQETIYKCIVDHMTYR